MHLPKAIISGVAAFLLLRSSISTAMGHIGRRECDRPPDHVFAKFGDSVDGQISAVVRGSDTGIILIQLYRISALRCSPLRVSLPSCRHLRVID